MIEQERTIIINEYGLEYSNLVTMFFENDEKDKRSIVFYCSPDGLYNIVKQNIASLSQTQESDTSNMDEEQRELRKRVTALARAAAKGFLLVAGDKLLELFLGSEHPRPPKAKRGERFDLIDWYLDIFARIGISHLMRHDIVLHGRIIKEEENGDTIAVHTVDTRPVAAAVESGD